MAGFEKPATSFGAALKEHRRARRMAQLDLALTSGLSARHVSFLETGRAQPSREAALALGAALDLPLGAQNALLNAAGFAPAFPASALSSAALAPFRAALTEMMARHAPFPALICDRRWNLIDANESAAALLAALRESAGDNLILMLTESPLAPQAIGNYAEVLSEMTARIRLEAIEAAGDPFHAMLLEKLSQASARHPYAAGGVRQPVMPLVLNAPSGPLRFLSMIAHFSTSEDVTVRDLRLELFFPADDETRAAMGK